MKRSNSLPWQPARDPERSPAANTPPMTHKCDDQTLEFQSSPTLQQRIQASIGTHQTHCLLLLMLELKQDFYFSPFSLTAKKAKAGNAPTGRAVALLLTYGLKKLKTKHLGLNVVSSLPPQRRFQCMNQISLSPNAELTSSNVSQMFHFIS